MFKGFVKYVLGFVLLALPLQASAQADESYSKPGGDFKTKLFITNKTNHTLYGLALGQQANGKKKGDTMSQKFKIAAWSQKEIKVELYNAETSYGKLVGSVEYQGFLIFLNESKRDNLSLGRLASGLKQSLAKFAKKTSTNLGQIISEQVKIIIMTNKKPVTEFEKALKNKGITAYSHLCDDGKKGIDYYAFEGPVLSLRCGVDAESVAKKGYVILEGLKAKVVSGTKFVERYFTQQFGVFYDKALFNEKYRFPVTVIDDLAGTCGVLCQSNENCWGITYSQDLFESPTPTRQEMSASMSKSCLYVGLCDFELKNNISSMTLGTCLLATNKNKPWNRKALPEWQSDAGTTNWVQRIYRGGMTIDKFEYRGYPPQ